MKKRVSILLALCLLLSCFPGCGKEPVVQNTDEDYFPLFSCGLLPVQKTGTRLCGCVNEKGKIAIPLQFQDAKRFSSCGLAAVQLDGKWGYINQKGKMVIRPQFDKAEVFRGRVARVWKNGKIGLVHPNGKIVAKPKYALINPWAVNGRIAFREENGAHGYFDEDGRIVIPARYIRCTSGEVTISFFVDPFFDDGYTVSRLDRKRVVIDRDGNHLLGEEDGLFVLDYGVVNTLASREQSLYLFK